MTSPPAWIIKTVSSTGRPNALGVWWSPDDGLFTREVFPPPRRDKKLGPPVPRPPDRTEGLTATKIIAYLSDWERRGAITLDELGQAIEEIGRVMRTAEYGQAIAEYRQRHGKSRWGAP